VTVVVGLLGNRHKTKWRTTKKCADYHWQSPLVGNRILVDVSTTVRKTKKNKKKKKRLILTSTIIIIIFVSASLTPMCFGDAKPSFSKTSPVNLVIFLHNQMLIIAMMQIRKIYMLLTVTPNEVSP